MNEWEAILDRNISLQERIEHLNLNTYIAEAIKVHEAEYDLPE